MRTKYHLRVTACWLVFMGVITQFAIMLVAGVSTRVNRAYIWCALSNLGFSI